MQNEIEFTAAYLADRSLIEVQSQQLVDDTSQRWVHITDAAGRSVYLDVRNVGEGEDEHLCIDVHAFQNGEPVLTAPWGMTRGRAHSLDHTGFRTFDKPAVPLAVLLVGPQPRKPECIFGGWPEVGDTVYVDQGDSIGRGEFTDTVTAVTQEVITFAQHGPHTYDQLSHLEITS